MSNYLIWISLRKTVSHRSVYHTSACVSACLPRDRWKKGRSEQREKLSADRMPARLLLHLPPPRLGVGLSSGQSVDRCSGLEDIRQLAETPYASSECAARLPDTCLRSVQLSHASVAPRATWLSGKHDSERRPAASTAPELDGRYVTEIQRTKWENILKIH